MEPTTTMTTVGLPGWLATLALVDGAVVRLLKTDAANAVLDKLGLPEIPKKVLPWLAISFGLGGGILDGVMNGQTAQQALLAGFWGLIGGTGAIAGQELMSPTVRSVFGDGVADAIFGAKAPVQIPVQEPKKAPSIRPGVLGILGVLALVFGIGMGTSGCAALASVGPIVSDIVIGVEDASEVLSLVQLAEQQYFSAKPDATAQKAIEADITKARLSLDAALQAAQGTGEVNVKDVSGAITDFKAAYADLMTLLQASGVQVSVASPAPAMGASTGLVIHEPLLLHYQAK